MEIPSRSVVSPLSYFARGAARGFGFARASAKRGKPARFVKSWTMIILFRRTSIAEIRFSRLAFANHVGGQREKLRYPAKFDVFCAEIFFRVRSHFLGFVSSSGDFAMNIFLFELRKLAADKLISCLYLVRSCWFCRYGRLLKFAQFLFFIYFILCRIPHWVLATISVFTYNI